MPFRSLNHRNLVATAATCLALAALSVTGCGGSDTPDPATPTAPATSGQADSPRQDGPNGPASAGDRRDPAPDDVISERPGGPRDPDSGSGQ